MTHRNGPEYQIVTHPSDKSSMAWTATPEGRIMAVGALVGLMYAAWLVVYVFHDLKTAKVMWGMTASHVFFGRAAGMSFGYTLGLDHGPVITANMLIEGILVLLFYPAFVFGCQKLPLPAFVTNLIDRTRTAAERQRHKVRRYGIPGLMIFVWLPFWMTGPLVGCIIGFLMGLKPWLNMGVVLGGTFVAILGYALILKHLHHRMLAINPHAPLMLLLAIVLVALAVHLIGKSRQPRS